MRVVVELKQDASPQIIENLLFKHSALESSFALQSGALPPELPRLERGFSHERLEQFMAIGPVPAEVQNQLARAVVRRAAPIPHGSGANGPAQDDWSLEVKFDNTGDVIGSKKLG